MADVLDKPAAVQDLVRDISKTVSEAVDDGVRTVLRAIKQGREAADDAIDDARHAVRRNPMQSMGVIFAFGVVTGAFAAWIGTRRS